MAEFRQELFKKNGIKRTKSRDYIQKENRKKRTSFFDLQRNIKTDEDGKPFITSTPFCKKTNPESIKDENITIKKVRPLSVLENDEKQSKREAYVGKFVEWKKKKQQQSNKQDKKPPFIPCGKPKKSQLNEWNASLSSFAPSNYKFKAPNGISTVFETLKNESIYVALATPPRKAMKESKSANNLPTTSTKGISKPNIALLESNRNVVNKGAIPKILKATDASTSHQAVASKRTISTNPLLATNSSTNQPVLGIIKTDAINKGAIPKTSYPVKSTNKTANNLIATAPEKKATVNKGAIPKKAINSCSALGANSKAKALTQKTMPPVKPPERARLAVNLKAKSKLAPCKNLNKNKFITQKTKKGTAPALVTPLELCKSLEAFNFVTSTQVKSPMFKLNNIKPIALSSLCNTVSPIESQKNEKAAVIKPKSAKRAILQPASKFDAENMVRKFNFIKEQKLETTVSETPKPDTSKPKCKEVKNFLQSNSAKVPTPRCIKLSPRRLLLKENKGKQYDFIKKLTMNDSTDIEKTLVNIETNKFTNKTLRLQERDLGENTTKSSEETIPESENNDKTLKSNITNEIKTPERASNYLSPFVTCSRGKVSARKEREKRDSIYLPSTPNKILNPATESKVAETPIEIRRGREAVLYFRQQLSNEIQRLHALCDKWQAYKDDELDKLSQCGGNDMIDVAIGQTKLLTSKKFMQFNGLIDRCESHVKGTAAPDDGSEDTKIITSVDLEGFWSMLGLQVENIEKRFENLERWKSNEWQDPDAQKLEDEPKKKTSRVKKKAVNKIKPRANAALVQKMREMRAAMRLNEVNAKNNEISEHENQQQQNTESPLIKPCSPRRLRRSTLTKTEATRLRESLSINTKTTPDRRMCIIVPDRRSRSIAPTVISIPSPIGRSSSPFSPSNKNGTKKNEQQVFLKKAVHTRRSLRKSTDIVVKVTPADDNIVEDKQCSMFSNVAREVTPHPLRTPSPVNDNRSGYKPILKTPGTARTQPRNVSFNVLCSVQKFRKFGEYLEATEYDKIEQVRIDEVKLKLALEPDIGDETPRAYSLRNRKVKLRPSAEIEIPK